MAETVGIDRFAISLERMLSGIQDDIDAELPKAVRKAVAKGRVAARDAISGQIEGETADRYVRGISTRTRGSGHAVHGSVGNRETPGLVHLLEKGHAQMGGGRVRAFPHMEQGRKAAEDELMAQLGKAVGEALR